MPAYCQSQPNSLKNKRHELRYDRYVFCALARIFMTSRGIGCWISEGAMRLHLFQPTRFAATIARASVSDLNQGSLKHSLSTRLTSADMVYG